jgi:hypothetical protein
MSSWSCPEPRKRFRLTRPWRETTHSSPRSQRTRVISFQTRSMVWRHEEQIQAEQVAGRRVDLGHTPDLDRAAGKAHGVGRERVIEAARTGEHALGSARRNQEIDDDGCPGETVDGHGQTATDRVLGSRCFQGADEGRELVEEIQHAAKS